MRIDLDGGRFFFNAVKEGDSVVFAADDEAESHLWVMALYRATGQSHKPAPPVTPSGKSSTIAKIQGGILFLILFIGLPNRFPIQFNNLWKN